ncbi:MULTISPECIES: D-alanyl-D-alanine carboxypeptidase family protein [Anaerostipes]|uniref:D-alanyl-D-alanine carboxypeptidase family protein n=2 Tax=Lachnospiraceae TaxID=186803 RepID=UPI001FA88F9C|nr:MULTISPECIES: serine hydrolase [unclassified Anaerostipes]MCI5622483.1 serine hydrolase [Anaerostipes sp.]
MEEYVQIDCHQTVFFYKKTYMKKLVCIFMSVILMTLSGCQIFGNDGSLTTSYESHYEKNETEIKEKTLDTMWQSKAAQVGVVSKKDADHVTYSNVKEALLVNNETNEVLVAQKVFDQAFPASTTKIMTALLTLENCDLNKIVTIKKDIKFKDGAAVALHLKAGDKITVEALLNALIVMSANDAAIALGEEIAGSEKAFVKMMNQRAKELGATNTHFANPNGLHLENHYTTAYDLYLIFKELTKHNEYFDIAGKSSSYIEYTNKKNQLQTYDMAATNQYILGNYTLPHQVFMIGGKTGTTTQAGSCLIILTKNKKGEEFISVILKGKDKSSLYHTMSKILSKEN